MSDIGSFRSMDKYLSNMDQRRAWAVAFFLAMVNAADAVEIMSIGSIHVVGPQTLQAVG